MSDQKLGGPSRSTSTSVTGEKSRRLGKRYKRSSKEEGIIRRMSNDENGCSKRQKSAEMAVDSLYCEYGGDEVRISEAIFDAIQGMDAQCQRCKLILLLCRERPVCTHDALENIVCFI